MGTDTSIQWTDATWSPVTGCTAVSPGCAHCYSAQLTATRLKASPKYAGLAVLNGSGHGVFTGEVRCHEDWLDQPLRWRAPRMIFVNSMSDTFHKDVPDDFIDRMFAVMALCPRHTFQVLTKRPERMAEYLGEIVKDPDRLWRRIGPLIGENAFNQSPVLPHRGGEESSWWDEGGPLPNVWIGTSAEDQDRANQRVPFLLRCPGAVRFISYEPALGPIDFSKVPDEWDRPSGHGAETLLGDIDWLICGGESGNDARGFDLGWARDIRDQCKAAGTAFFFKQAGARPYVDQGFSRRVWLEMEDRKGGTLEELPADLRVREFPKGARR